MVESLCAGSECKVRTGTVYADIARLYERMDSFERWQSQQNGYLQRVEERVAALERRINMLGWGIAATLGGVLLDLILHVGGMK